MLLRCRGGIDLPGIVREARRRLVLVAIGKPGQNVMHRNGIGGGAVRARLQVEAAIRAPAGAEAPEWTGQRDGVQPSAGQQHFENRLRVEGDLRRAGFRHRARHAQSVMRADQQCEPFGQRRQRNIGSDDGFGENLVLFLRHRRRHRPGIEQKRLCLPAERPERLLLDTALGDFLRRRQLLR